MYAELTYIQVAVKGHDQRFWQIFKISEIQQFTEDKEFPLLGMIYIGISVFRM